MKTCSRCGQQKPHEEFTRQRKTKDGYAGWCRQCHRQYDIARRSSPRQKAIDAWHSIERRVENRDGRSPSYANIRNLWTKEEFIEWATGEIENFLRQHPGEQHSIDRINPDGHYCRANCRVLSLADNRALARWGGGVPRPARPRSPRPPESFSSAEEYYRQYGGRI